MSIILIDSNSMSYKKLHCGELRFLYVIREIIQNVYLRYT